MKSLDTHSAVLCIPYAMNVIVINRTRRYTMVKCAYRGCCDSRRKSMHGERSTIAQDQSRCAVTDHCNWIVARDPRPGNGGVPNVET